MDDKVKAALLDLLIEVKRICEKNNIQYFLVGGTLIGAVRHNGFIPWDDDIDVGMLREDYERFIQACKNDLSGDYRLINWKNDIDNPNLYSKLKIKGTKYVEKISQNGNQNNEIFIDIFPFDFAPENDKKSEQVGRKIAFYRRLLAIKCNVDFSGNKSFHKRIANHVMKIISKIYSKEKLYSLSENLCQFSGNQNSAYVVNANGAYSYLKERIPLVYVNRTTEILFEGKFFSVPIKYQDYLTHIYGDYMKLPPVEKRTSRHEICEIDFGKYVIKSNLTSKENAAHE